MMTYGEESMGKVRELLPTRFYVYHLFVALSLHPLTLVHVDFQSK